LRHADRFPNEHEQLERDAGPHADVTERLRRQGRKPLEGLGVEEVERERAALDRRGNTVERDAALLDRLDHHQPTHIAGRVSIALCRGEDPEINQAGEVAGLDSGPVGGVLG